MSDNGWRKGELDRLRQALQALRTTAVLAGEPMSRHTRFGIGGPAALYVEVRDPESFFQILSTVRSSTIPLLLIGGGTNLIVADGPLEAVVVRFRGERTRRSGCLVEVEAGADLQALVDYTIQRGLGGIHTMTGIPGTVGGAVYGNAGAYGRCIADSVTRVRYHDGSRVATLSREECAFRYRDSVFKRRKDWLILSVELRLTESEAGALSARAAEIAAIRNVKYPPEMRCAGSIFKNLLLEDLAPEVAAQVPEAVIREGKVPAAWFLEQVGAKGERRGGIRVADYHANLIFNEGGGTAAQLCELIQLLKRRVWDRFGLSLEEEVQYIGF